MELTLKSNQIFIESVHFLRLIRFSLRKSTLLVQWAGYLPLYFTPDHHLYFPRCGFPTINLLCQLLSGLVCYTFCWLNSSHHDEFAEKNWSSAEKFAYGVMINTLILSHMLNKLISFLLRHKFIKFYHNFSSVMAEICSAFGNYQFVNHNQNQDQILESVRKKLAKNENHIKYIGICLVLFQLGMFIMMGNLLMTMVTKSGGHNLLDIVVFIGATIFCHGLSVYHSVLIYWFVSIGKCIGVGFTLLEIFGEGSSDLMSSVVEDRQNFEKVPANNNDSKLPMLQNDEILMNVSNFVNLYRKLGSVVKDFNSTFKINLAVILFASCLFWILHFFVFISTVIKKGLDLGSVVAGGWTVLDVISIVLICDVSSVIFEKVGFF